MVKKVKTPCHKNFKLILEENVGNKHVFKLLFDCKSDFLILYYFLNFLNFPSITIPKIDNGFDLFLINSLNYPFLCPNDSNYSF